MSWLASYIGQTSADADAAASAALLRTVEKKMRRERDGRLLEGLPAVYEYTESKEVRIPSSCSRIQSFAKYNVPRC